jgi:uroporphyrinogen-III decarboxylase
LGHGITPDVDPDRVAVLIDTVREHALPDAGPARPR